MLTCDVLASHPGVVVMLLVAFKRRSVNWTQDFSLYMLLMTSKLVTLARNSVKMCPSDMRTSATENVNC